MTDPEAIKSQLPGSRHEFLAKLAGRYKHVTKIRTEPDQDPEVSQGSAELSTILDGRFLKEERTGTMHGEPTHYLKHYGFNNATGRYEAIWTFNRSTAILFLTGEPDDEGKTISWSGSYEDPDRGKVLIEAATRLPSTGHFILEVYGRGPDGIRFTVQETSYHRWPPEKNSTRR